MLNQLFNSVFSQANLTIEPSMLLMSLLSSLVLGVILAGLYQYRTAYSKEFAISLVVLPSLIAVIIFLVNGNLGTSVAVAGTFSLIKFRSPASSSKELLLVFMATAIGLATGMGYLALAILVTLLVSVVMLALEELPFLKNMTSRRQITLSLPKVIFDQADLVTLLEKTCRKVNLVAMTAKKGQLELVYQLELMTSDTDLVNQLLAYHPEMIVQLTALSQKKKAL